MLTACGVIGDAVGSGAPEPHHGNTGCPTESARLGIYNAFAHGDCAGMNAVQDETGPDFFTALSALCAAVVDHQADQWSVAQAAFDRDSHHRLTPRPDPPQVDTERSPPRTALSVVTTLGPPLTVVTAGLCFLVSPGGRIFLLHNGWTPWHGTVIVLRDDDGLRWQFSRWRDQRGQRDSTYTRGFSLPIIW